MKKKKLSVILIVAAVFSTLVAGAHSVRGAETPKEPVCAVYLTGIGCSNCAVTDPRLFIDTLDAKPELIIFEYEIYRQRKENKAAKDAYFKNYLRNKQTGVPLLILHKSRTYLGQYEVLFATEDLLTVKSNPLPLPNGSHVRFKQLDLIDLSGDVKIWTKNRILLSGQKGDNVLLKKVLLADDLSQALADVPYERINPKPVPISRGEIAFEHAVKIGDWILQWNGSDLSAEPKPHPTRVMPQTSSPPKKSQLSGYQLYGIVLVLIFLAVILSSFRIKKTSKGKPLRIELKAKLRDCIIALASFGALFVFFLLAKGVTPDFLKTMGYRVPLPVFTFFIALVDGFNPCNMFVLTCLLALLVSTSDSRKRLIVVSLSFIGMVYIFYYMFMAAWLNVFNYIDFVDPLRITIAILAIGAGLINCKELFFFKKGISLTIQDRHKWPLMQRIDRMKHIIQHGSMPLLISSSIALASFASLVELPCTAGFPIIYTGILAGRGLESTTGYYLYLALYNLIYVLPLATIVIIFIYTLRARTITQRQMEIIKFIGGIIMILLGIVLLVNPSLIGLGMG